MISARLMPAIMEPMIVNQFLEEGGSFIVAGLSEYASTEVKIEK